jgi:hypothetical protein|nr:MAG TPA: hypothetical protein [Bacteriophage sp.]
MKKKEFYTLVMKNNKKQAIKVKGYILKTTTNLFGIYKNEFNEFDIIDLNTGLSVNYLQYYRLKDFKKDIRLFDNKLDKLKEDFNVSYNKYINNFNEIIERDERK